VIRPALIAVAALGAAALVSAAPVAGDQTPSAPGAVTTPVSIGYANYSPAKIDVLAGDTVAWHNDSVRRHTVTHDGGAFDSGTIPTGSDFAHRVEQVGAFRYYCRIHAGIRGEVDAWELLLERPARPAEAAMPYPLRGRAALPPGTPVSIEADDGSGAGFRPVATTTTGSQGSFTAVVSPGATASYRAVAGDVASPAVELLVLNHSISAAARAAGKSSVVSVQVTPPDPGATIVLQLNLRERFGWWPVASAPLDRNSRARFKLLLGRRVSARARLTLSDGATALATSGLVRVGPVSRARRR
jgi:plastocyanin